MELLCKDFKIVIDEFSGSPIEITSLEDEYHMNWVREDYIWGKVNGFETVSVKKTESRNII